MKERKKEKKKERKNEKREIERKKERKSEGQHWQGKGWPMLWPCCVCVSVCVCVCVCVCIWFSLYPSAEPFLEMWFLGSLLYFEQLLLKFLRLFFSIYSPQKGYHFHLFVCFLPFLGGSCYFEYGRFWFKISFILKHFWIFHANLFPPSVDKARSQVTQCYQAF